MNCWQTLNIEPTTDRRVIKKAYNKLLRANGPQDDAQLFQEQREAYEQALELMASEQTPEVATVEQPEPVVMDDEHSEPEPEPEPELEPEVIDDEPPIQDQNPEYMDVNTIGQRQTREQAALSDEQVDQCNQYLADLWALYENAPQDLAAWQTLLANDFAVNIHTREYVERTFLGIISDALKGWGTLRLQPAIPKAFIQELDNHFLWRSHCDDLETKVEPHIFDLMRYLLIGPAAVATDELSKQFYTDWYKTDEQQLVFASPSRLNWFAQRLVTVIVLVVTLIMVQWDSKPLHLIVFIGGLIGFGYELIAGCLAFKLKPWQMTAQDRGFSVSSTTDDNLFIPYYSIASVTHSVFPKAHITVRDHDGELLFRINKSASYYGNLLWLLNDVAVDNEQLRAECFGDISLYGLLYKPQSYQPVKEALGQLAQNDWDQRYYIIEALGDSFPLGILEDWVENEPESADGFLLLGLRLMNIAWSIRGAGQANTVSEEQHEKFFECLKESYHALNLACQYREADPTPWAILILVNLYASQGAEAIEQCFNEAISKDPDNWLAYKNRTFTLTQKWGGDNQQMLDFARDAANKAPAGSLVPIVLLKAMAENHFYFEQFADDQPAADEFAADSAIQAEAMAAYHKCFADGTADKSKCAVFARHEASVWFWTCRNLPELKQQFDILGGRIHPQHWVRFGKADQFGDALEAIRS